MTKTITEIISTRTLYFKIISKSDIDRYSLKKMDYSSERFQTNQEIIGFRPVLALSKPDIISELAERYFRAGCDIIVIESGSINKYKLQKYGLSQLSYELNYSYGKLVHEKASKYSNITRDKPRFVAGEITGLPDDLSKEELKIIYTEQYKALYAAKVDLILFNNFETIEQTIFLIELLNNLMIKRNKSTEFIISNKDENYLKEISKVLSEKVYSNINLISICSESKLQMEEGKNYYGSVLIDIEDKNNIEKIKEFLENKEFKLVGFRENITPDMLNKII